MNGRSNEIKKCPRRSRQADDPAKKRGLEECQP